MSLPPDQPPPASPPEKPKQSAAERRLRHEDRLASIRLRRAIGRELDERGISTPAAISEALAMPAAEAFKLMTRRQWREGDVARLQAAADRLGCRCRNRQAAAGQAKQPRAVTDLNLAGEYAEAILHGAAFPPVVVFGEAAGDYWLADGYPRWHAAGIAGLQMIAADVRPNGKREAILHSVGANAAHGWRRTNDDKQRAVMTLLNDPEWSQWSDREIGERCGVSFRTVGKFRPASLGKVENTKGTTHDRKA